MTGIVTVATVYLHGRTDYEKFHARLLSGRSKNSIFTPLETTARFLRHDMAVVHWSWKMTGDTNYDQQLVQSDAEIGLGKHVAPPKSQKPQSSIYVCDFCYFRGAEREAAGLSPRTGLGRAHGWF